MNGYDFDRTIKFLYQSGHVFPDKGVVITGRPYKQLLYIQEELGRLGLGKYQIIINRQNTISKSKDQRAIFKARSIMDKSITIFYDDDDYQLRIIQAFLRVNNHQCKLKQVTQSGSTEFQFPKM